MLSFVAVGAPKGVTVASELTAVKRRKVGSPDDNEVFTLTVKGRENYEILLKLRDSLELAASHPQAHIESYKRQQTEVPKQ